MTSLRKYSLAGGIFYLLTFVSIPHPGDQRRATWITTLSVPTGAALAAVAGICGSDSARASLARDLRRLHRCSKPYRSSRDAADRGLGILTRRLSHHLGIQSFTNYGCHVTARDLAL